MKSDDFIWLFVIGALGVFLVPVFVAPTIKKCVDELRKIPAVVCDVGAFMSFMFVLSVILTAQNVYKLPDRYPGALFFFGCITFPVAGSLGLGILENNFTRKAVGIDVTLALAGIVARMGTVPITINGVTTSFNPLEPLFFVLLLVVYLFGILAVPCVHAKPKDEDEPPAKGGLVGWAVFAAITWAIVWTIFNAQPVNWRN